MTPTAVGIAGLTLSFVAGALIGLGQGRVLVVVAAAAVSVTVLALLGSRLLAAPGRLGCWLLAAAFFAMPLNAFRVAGSVTLGDMLLLAAIPFALWAVVSRESLPRLPSWLYFGGGLLLTSVLLLELFPPGGIHQVVLTSTTVLQQQSDMEQSSNLMSGVRLLVALVFLPVATCFLADGWGKIRMLTDAWVAGVSLSCLVAVFGAVSGLDPLQAIAGFPLLGGGLYEGTRAVGFSVHPFTLSLTAVMAAPVVLTRITDLNSGLRYGPLFAVIVAAILLSGTRTGVLVLIAVCAAVLIADRRTRKVLGLVMLGGAAVLCVLLLFASIPGTERFQSTDLSAGESNRSRVTLYEESVRYIAERPIVGHGFELVRDSHNLFLQLLLAGGVIALVGFFTIFTGYLATGWRSRFRVPDRLYGDAVGLTLALVAFLLSGFLGNDIYARYLYIPAGLILAMSLIRGKASGSGGPSGENDDSGARNPSPARVR
ncbi:MAG TPA: O-antigen ligase family protein [Solirubrobacterales bacterium]|nr:O-antigen ligase family protein [Solirubrobacterales bacterium]